MYPPKTPLRAILKSHMLFTKKIEDEFVTKNVDFTKKKYDCTPNTITIRTYVNLC